MSNETVIQEKNIKVLMTEIYIFLYDISPQIISDIFQKKENCYSLTNPKFLVSKQKFITSYDIDTISSRGLQLWQGFPQDIKISDSLNAI